MDKKELYDVYLHLNDSCFDDLSFESNTYEVMKTYNAKSSFFI